MEATRERKIEFMRSFSPNAIRDAVVAALRRQGEEFFLTDDQLDDLVKTQVADWRESTRRHRQNRRRAA